ncbi:MAG: hypothetical protein LBD75_04975 [Candidatus Peribacteria bacterium]|nr:hypothetical protein [Candidatus Peribacteria bacterium]
MATAGWFYSIETKAIANIPANTTYYITSSLRSVNGDGFQYSPDSHTIYAIPLN